MPRQTYLSREFFVNASEDKAKACILSIPKDINNIEFVAEDNMRHTLNFIYEQLADAPMQNYIQVSLLPLDANQTRVSLHGSQNEGTPFYKDMQVENALFNFERAVQAAIDGRIQNFELQEIKTSKNKGISTVVVFSLVAALAYMLVHFLT